MIFVLAGISASLSQAAEFTYEGVQFSYDDTLAAKVTGENVPAEPITHGPPALETGSPDHLRVAFDHDATPGVFDPHDAQLLIFPVKDYRMIFQVVVDTIDALHALISKKPEAIEGNLPFLPPMTATQTFGVQIKYLDFQNGSGIRYITHYSQEPAEITNKDILYTYQGLTTDGAYYVSFVFPLSAKGIPEKKDPRPDPDTFAENYESYLTKVIQNLHTLSSQDYTPDVTLLDVIIESLVVKPTSLSE